MNYRVIIDEYKDVLTTKMPLGIKHKGNANFENCLQAHCSVKLDYRTTS